MSKIQNFSKSLLLLSSASLSLISLPAEAVNYNGTWTLNRNNTGGTTFAVLRPHASNFCYLSKVGVTETDTGSESATCRVRISNTVWLLESILGRSSDADVSCSATCYTR